MTTLTLFWMVYADGKGEPTRQHPTLAAACQEAERLAKKNGTTAFVLQAVQACVPSSTVSWIAPEAQKGE